MKPLECRIHERGSPMTAAEARQLTNAALNPHDGTVAALVKHVVDQVAWSIKRSPGDGSIIHPFNAKWCSFATEKQIEAAIEELGRLGYRVEYKTDEVQGRSWREVSW